MLPRNKLLVSVLALAAVAIVGFVLLRPAGQQSDQPRHPPMRMAKYYWPGMYWIDVARAKGWFDEAGLAVEFVDANVDYYQALDDLEQGSLDTITVWLFDVVKRNHGGADWVMVLATDESNGSEALVAAPGISSIEELKGRRIGVTLGTTLAYELDVMLARFGLTFNDVIVVDIESEKAAGELANGRVDAVITWEPYASQAVATGGRRIYDSSQLPGVTTAGMVFRKGFIEQRPQDIQRMLEVWLRATQYISDHQDEAFAIVAEANDVTPQDVARFEQLNRTLGLRENVGAFTYASGLESLFGSARKINRFLIQREPGISKPIDGTALLDGQFVRNLAREKDVL